jgi:hypothetical protein
MLRWSQNLGFCRGFLVRIARAAEMDWFCYTRIRVITKCQRLKEMSVVLLTKCPKPFTGVKEHCSLVKGRNNLSKCDEK